MIVSLRSNESNVSRANKKGPLAETDRPTNRVSHSYSLLLGMSHALQSSLNKEGRDDRNSP